MGKIKVPIKTMVDTEIHPIDAFRILCQTLDMPFVMNEFVNLSVEKNMQGKKCVYIKRAGKKEIYDDRGDLFVALRNVAACMVPDIGFKDADYIYKD